MVQLDNCDEERLDALGWLQGATLRGVQVDAERREVALYLLKDGALLELSCREVGYLALPNLFDGEATLRVVGLVAQPLEEDFSVRLEFANHPSQIHLRCKRLKVADATRT
jgi:hypothetical protein